MDSTILEIIKDRDKESFSKKLGDSNDLDLSNQGVDDEDLGFVFKCIDVNIIKRLWINGNRITDKGMKPLSKFLKKSKSLTYLNIGRNVIGAKGLETLLSNGLKKNESLLCLRMYDVFKTPITSTRILSNFLKANKNLLVLDISSNGIRKKAFSSLLEAISLNESLIVLQLRDNGITDLDVMGFMEVLEEHKTINTVDLTNNHITNRGVRMILDVLEGKKTLIEFPIWGNQISDLQLIQHEIQRVLQRNKEEMRKLANSLRYDDIKSFQTLIGNGTNIFSQNLDGNWNNILHLIVKHNRKSFLWYLVKHLPPTTLRNLTRYHRNMKNFREQGKTALTLSKELDRTWFVELLYPEEVDEKKIRTEESSTRPRALSSAKDNWGSIAMKLMGFTKN